VRIGRVDQPDEIDFDIVRACPVDAVEQAARIDNHLRNTEQGIPVWICRHQRVPWAELWPKLTHHA
jgi:hypothetical protein